jgi:hypothetical protein
VPCWAGLQPSCTLSASGISCRVLWLERLGASPGVPHNLPLCALLWAVLVGCLAVPACDLDPGFRGPILHHVLHGGVCCGAVRNFPQGA